MQTSISTAAVTALLDELHARDGAADCLNSAVFGELRHLAEIYMRREGAGHTLQPTALVHEAYLRLVGDQARPWQNRGQFIGVAASIMRRLLIDHARKKKAGKRQAPGAPEPHGSITMPEAEMLLDLNFALERLEKSNERHARVVELRYFGGLSIEETAEAMQTSPMTVKRDWIAARAWLKGQIHPTGSDLLNESARSQSALGSMPPSSK